MTVNVYNSADASAPVINASAGDLINLLDKCLVTGYGAKAGAGWTKPYTGTNLAVFRMGGGNQRYLRIDDSSVAATRLARLVAYESMSAVSTGTNAFPTEAQMAGGLAHITSNSAGVKDWTVVATDKMAYIMTSASTGGTGIYSTLTIFGDITSYVAGDQYQTVLISNNTTVLQGVPSSGSLSGAISTMLGGHYIARKFDQNGIALNNGKHADMVKASANMGTGSIPYPNPSDGGLYLSPVWANETLGGLRGLFPGLWSSCHPVGAFANNDTFAGAGSLAGKTFVVKTFGSSGLSGSVILETSDTW